MKLIKLTEQFKNSLQSMKSREAIQKLCWEFVNQGIRPTQSILQYEYRTICGVTASNTLVKEVFESFWDNFVLVAGRRYQAESYPSEVNIAVDGLTNALLSYCRENVEVEILSLKSEIDRLHLLLRGKDEEIIERNEQINAINTQVVSLNSQVSNLESSNNQYKQMVVSLNNQINDINEAWFEKTRLLELQIEGLKSEKNEILQLKENELKQIIQAHQDRVSSLESLTQSRMEELAGIKEFLMKQTYELRTELSKETEKYKNDIAGLSARVDMNRHNYLKASEEALKALTELSLVKKENEWLKTEVIPVIKDDERMSGKQVPTDSRSSNFAANLTPLAGNIVISVLESEKLSDSTKDRFKKLIEIVCSLDLSEDRAIEEFVRRQAKTVQANEENANLLWHEYISETNGLNIEGTIESISIELDSSDLD